MESQINELAEMIESGQADNINLSHQVNNLKELIVTMTTAMANKIDTIQVVTPPPSGHDINDKVNNELMVTNLTSVVKQELNEAINSSEDHIIFSGDVSTTRMEQEDTKEIINLEFVNIPPSTVKQEKILTCEEQILTMDSDDDEEDNIKDNLSLSSTRKPSEDDKKDNIKDNLSLSSTKKPSEDEEEDISLSSAKKTKKSKHYASFGKRKVRKAKRKVQQKGVEVNYYIDWCLTVISAVCFSLFQTSKFLFFNEKQQAIWTLFFLIASGSMFPNVVSAAHPNSAIRLPGEDT